MALKRRMVSWLTALSGHYSRDNSVLIATMALIVVALIDDAPIIHRLYYINSQDRIRSSFLHSLTIRLDSILHRH